MKTMVWNVTHAKHVSLHGKKKNITNTFFLLFTKGLRLFHTIRWEKKNIYIYIIKVLMLIVKETMDYVMSIYMCLCTCHGNESSNNAHHLNHIFTQFCKYPWWMKNV
jgi:hypothetical protein